MELGFSESNSEATEGPHQLNEEGFFLFGIS